MPTRQERRRAQREAQKEVRQTLASKGIDLWRFRFLILTWCVWISFCAEWITTNRLHDGLPLAILSAPWTIVILHSSADWIRDVAWVIILHIWPQWMLNMLPGERSVRQYLDEYGVVYTRPIYGGGSAVICTKYGRNLWSGFINVVIDAHNRHQSWGGEFSMEDLRMTGHRCRIKLEPMCDGSFANLLLDLSTLARLLLVDEFKDAEKPIKCIKKLYEMMISPKVGSHSPEARKQSFLKLLRDHPAVKSPREVMILISALFHAYKSMGLAEKKLVDDILFGIKLTKDWRDAAKLNTLLKKVLTYKPNCPTNTSHSYDLTTDHLFRFLRNFQAHGGQANEDDGQQNIFNLEELEYIASYIFSSFISELIYELVMQLEMQGMLEYAWQNYTCP